MAYPAGEDPFEGIVSTLNTISGDYTFGKKLDHAYNVRLAIHNSTGDKFAVKTFSRAQPNDASPQEEPRAEDKLRDTRILREAAISMLLHHPNICAMREMIVDENYYHSVFEYVEGRQMLDHIISHGRLRERAARKIARQIGSALEYCHRNNIVHRDLKLENILITNTDDIKIMNFSLSNVYDPMSHLSTLCGTSYFPAPELLNMKPHIGPEVDVWNFGVVLYILVCGKVPFDAESIPALHAELLRCVVKYPSWISLGFKQLISRMLVTNPAQRASLSEVLNHPWMVHGFGGHPDAHFPRREPLRAEELDEQVIRRMQGFNFGTEEEIMQQLVHILELDTHANAVGGKESDCGGGLSKEWDQTSSDSTLVLSPDISQEDLTEESVSNSSSAFDFNLSKRFSSWFTSLARPLSRTSPDQGSLDANGLPSDSILNRKLLDPTWGVRPLLSIYYLTREMIERERRG